MAEENVQIPTPGESPILPTPETPAAPVETNVTALISELERAGVTNTEQLQGKLVASREAGNLAVQLGDTRKKVADLETLLASQQPNEEPFGTDYNETVDIRKVLREEIEANDNRKMKAQVDAQNQIQAVWQDIQTDEDYPLVKEIWESKLQDPAFVFQIQQGQVNPGREYTNVVRGFYKGIAKKSADAIKALQSGGVITPPHVETGVSGVPVQPGKITVNQQKITDLTKKVNEGGNLTQAEELDALLATLTD
jgi:hypothetical protein